MSHALRRNPDFRTDLRVQIIWYLEDADEDVARRFETPVEQTVLAIIQQPEIGRVRNFQHSRLRGLHSFRVRRPFNKFVLFYRVDDHAIEFWRLMYGSRDLPRRLLQPPGMD